MPKKLIGTSISGVLVTSTNLPFLSTLLLYDEIASAKFIEFLAGWWHHCRQSAQNLVAKVSLCCSGINHKYQRAKDQNTYG
jgi:hypothetical protein